MSTLKRYNISEVTEMVKPPNLQDITVTPSLDEKTYTYDSSLSYNGLGVVTVKGVTSEIDENIKPENITEGVTILGVEGKSKGNGIAAMVGDTVKVITAEDLQGITKIRNSAFRESGITDIEIPDNITKIDSYAFYNAAYLYKIPMGNGVETISNGALSYVCTGGGGRDTKQTLVLPSSLKTLTSQSIYNITVLSVLDMRNCVNLKTIDGYFGYGCPISEIYFPETENTITINTSYFLRDATAKKLKIPNNITIGSSGSYAFYNCYELLTLDLPENFNLIGSYFCGNCHRLKKLVLRSKSVPLAQTNILSAAYVMKGTTNSTYNPNGEKGTIYVPDDLVASYQSLSPWSNFNIAPLSEYVEEE